MVAAAALIRRRRTTRPRRARVPVQAYPTNIEREYERVLVSLCRDMHEGILDALAGPFELRHDADGDQPPIPPTVGLVMRKIGLVRVAVERTVTSSKARLLAQGVGRRVDKFNRVAVGDQIKAVIGVDPIRTTVETFAPGLVDRFARDNVDLIKSIPERYFSDIEKLATESVQIGRRPEVLSKMLRERYEVSKSRATLIARDQIGKLTGQLTRARQTNLGIDAYIWRSSRDERVREEHRDLEGQRFRWSDPPAEGHPGEAIQCRCRAEPDLSALLGD